MTRKHLRQLAEILNAAKPSITPLAFEQLLCDLSLLLQDVNPAFNETLFREAANASQTVRAKSLNLNKGSN